MSIFEALALGIVQGLTEFLPVSSSGHLVLVEHWFGLNVEGLLSFDVVVHAGTLVALMGYFWRDLWGMVVALRLFNASSLLVLLVVATTPAVVLAPFVKDSLETVFRGADIVVVMLGVTAVLLASAELFGRFSKDRPWSWQTALVMGCFQAVAMIPGISRSGSTIVGGMMMGLSRERAARFSFLMAIPAILGAVVFLGKDILEQGASGVGIGALVAGFVSSAVVSLGAIHFMLRFLRTRSLWIFVTYLVVLILGYIFF